MRVAITRDVSPGINACELTHLPRVDIDIDLANRQHEVYRGTLRTLGLEVINLPPLPDLPDSVFVEDPALVLDEVAILTRPGAASRQAEGQHLAAILREYRPLETIHAPATLEGGDVCRVGRTLLVGLSGRTNTEGIRQLTEIAVPLGYTVVTVPVTGCLHLKSACCALGSDRVLINPAWIEVSWLRDMTRLEIPSAEPRGANVLAIDDDVVLPAAHLQTADRLAREGYRIHAIDNSELLKAESGVTCSSLVFEA